MKLKVCVTRKIPDKGLDLLKPHFDLKISPYNRVLKREELLKFVKDQDAILSLLTDNIDDEVLKSAGPKLKIVANYAVGYDNIDLKAATERKIMVTNTPGVLTEAVAEHTLALLLATARRIPESDQFVRHGHFKGWGPLLYLGSELHGKTLGIIGLGRIGAAVAQRAFMGFGLRIIYHSRTRNSKFEHQFKAKHVTLKTLLKDSDFISVHLPLVKETHHFISKPELKLMKPTTHLINTSRGKIIDEKALVIALKERKIAGAALDVFEKEPLLSPGLNKLENVILTPHTASGTIETRETMSQIAAQNIILALTNKKPINLLNQEAYERPTQSDKKA